VAHTCNPNYLEGRDQEDSGSKPTQENSLKSLSQKPLHTQKIGLEWLKVKALSSSPTTTKKKKKKKKEEELHP
jgi:hypothetical protein